MKDNIITMLMQVFALAIAGVTVGALLRAGVGAGASARGERDGGRLHQVTRWLGQHAGGLAITITVIAAFSFWTQTWSFWVSRTTERRTNAHLSPIAAAYADASLDKTSTPFLEFAASRIPSNGSYAIAPPSQAKYAFTRQWTSYVLTPRLLTDEANADAVLIVNADPKKAAYDRERFPKLMRFNSRYALALRAEGSDR